MLVNRMSFYHVILLCVYFGILLLMWPLGGAELNLIFLFSPSSVSMTFAGSVLRSGKSTAHQQEATIAAPVMRSSSR